MRTIQTKDQLDPIYDVIVIGAGPAGMAAALAAGEAGAAVLIIDRDRELGGILNQCIHNGFGIHEFKEELTGPEFALRLIRQIEDTPLDVLLDTMVIELKPELLLMAVRSGEILHLRARAVVLAMGCRERTAGAIAVAGSRPGGIYTAGMAQKLANLEGYLVGKEILIYGSGDIGLIMARRMTLEGAHVKAVVEIMPTSSGLPRNIAQCLDDFGIPLKLSTSIARIHGHQRVTGATLVQVDDYRRPIAGTEEEITCDTILLSVGLIPENELTIGAGIPLHPVTGGPCVDSAMMTRTPGIFACGNVLHVHDIADFVTREGRMAGAGAARFARGAHKPAQLIPAEAGSGIRYVIPSGVYPDDRKALFSMRPVSIFRNATLIASQGDRNLYQRRFRILNPSEMIQVELELKHPMDDSPIVFTVEDQHE